MTRHLDDMTRVRFFAGQGVVLRPGDLFRVAGSQSRWRFLAWVRFRDGRQDYIECKEVRRSGERAGVRCVDPAKVAGRGT